MLPAPQNGLKLLAEFPLKPGETVEFQANRFPSVWIETLGAGEGKFSVYFTPLDRNHLYGRVPSQGAWVETRTEMIELVVIKNTSLTATIVVKRYEIPNA